jgi:hypothetical protein
MVLPNLPIPQATRRLPQYPKSNANKKVAQVVNIYQDDDKLCSDFYIIDTITTQTSNCKHKDGVDP